MSRPHIDSSGPIVPIATQRLLAPRPLSRSHSFPLEVSSISDVDEEAGGKVTVAEVVEEG
jgi:hypothetical protein